MKPKTLLATTTVFLEMTMIPSAAIITAQPTNQSVSLGANARFHVVATTTNAPILYQWRFAKTSLPAATNSILTLTNVQIRNTGDYDTVLTDGSGSVTSVVAHLEVDGAFTKVTEGSIVNDGGNGFGCAWGDYDEDGFIDLFVCNFPDNTTGVQHDFLYHNRGDGTFERITTVPMVNANAWATGASWGDYNNDGKLDLFVARPGNNGSGPNTLYRDDGNGHFTKISSGLIVTQSLTSHAGIWADVDNDGLLDVLVANFRSSGATGPSPDNYLYHNSGGGAFQRTVLGAKAALGGDSFDVAAADFNNDGWIDLVVAQGATKNKQNSLLYTNQHDGSFILQTHSAVFTNLANAAAVAGADYDNDGFVDLFISTNPEGKNLLYHNNRDGTLTLVTNSIMGLDVGSSAGCAWADYDNDGWLDLFVARIGEYDSNFNVIRQENNCLYHNHGDGTFTKITAGSLVNEPGYSFGCAWGDINNDGFPDLFVSNGFVRNNANNFLYRNNGNSNNWINFKLVGTVSNRSAIGAKVRVQATIGGRFFWQLREISGGSGHGCQNDMRANFGLGDATNVSLVRIEWPSGIVQEFADLAAKQFLTIYEPPRLLTGITNGVPQLLMKGGIGFQYELSASANLSEWTPLSTSTITNQSGFLMITDTTASNLGARFYRGRQVSP